MGRKKKVTKVEEKKETKTGTNVGYSGTVSVKILHGNKAVKNIKIKNNGCKPLFKFLVDCLKGNYNEANAPRYLRGFTTTSTDHNIFDYNNEVTLRLIPISAIADGSVDTDSASSVRYSFLAPGSFFVANAQIDEIALYSSSNMNRIDTPSAFINFHPIDPSEEYTPIVVSPDTNLVIIWELSISNI